MSQRSWGWIGPLAVAALAFVLRVWDVAKPNRLMFDETYYAKDAWSLTRFGYVQEFVDNANSRIVKGQLTDLFTGQPSQIVHPEGGKWMIALGEWAFGMSPFGWRIAAVVAGSLTVLVLARLVRRLTGSTAIGCVAGLLLCFDGLHFVLSRIALLDVFVAFWIVAAVACLVADRDWITARLDRVRVFRPWQLLAGVCFGMACATKWNGIYVLAVFGLLVVVWEVLARRHAWRDTPVETRGPRRPGWVMTALVTGVPAFVWIVGIAFVVYLVSWTGWLLHHEVYEQRFATPAWGPHVVSPSSGFLGETRDALSSLWHYHVLTYDFHTGDYLAGKTHPYESNPLGWLVLARPVGVDAQNDLPAASCGAPAASSCMREVLILGNPLIWWTGALAIVVAVVAWMRTRSWRWSVPVLGVAATWLPWFQYDDRPIFLFYAVAILPFTIIAMCLALRSIVDAAHTPRTRYLVWLLTGAALCAVVITFWFFHPVLTDQLISYDTWMRRMWFTSWI